MTRSAAIPQLRAEAQAADVVSLRTEDDRGFILYRGQEQSIWAIPVADDNGAWKVAALAGLQLN